MPQASVPTLCTIPAASTALDPEFARVLRMSDPGVALDGMLTFAPTAGIALDAWLDAWRAWRDGPCTTVLGPAMIAAADLAGQGKAREILELNGALHAALEPLAAARSALAGARLLRRLAASRGERWLGKLQAQTDSGGGAPVHFPIVYAAQSALFHLPLRQLVPAYAYWEWIAALPACAPAAGCRPDFTCEAASLGAAAQTILSSRESHVDDAKAVFGRA